MLLSNVHAATDREWTMLYYALNGSKVEVLEKGITVQGPIEGVADEPVHLQSTSSHWATA